MSIVKPVANRYTADFLGDHLAIYIPNRKLWAQISFVCVWLLFGASLLVSSSAAFLSDYGIHSLVFLWTAAWLIGAVYAMSAIAWQFAGGELVEISHYSLLIRRQLFGVGWTKGYVASDVHDLRVLPRPLPGHSRDNELLYFWNKKGPVAFNYGAKLIRFGGGMDETEAKQIVKLIQQHYPQYK